MAMKCESCGVEMMERKTTLDTPYPYVVSGLKDLVLVGILVRQCPQCKAESPVIPKVGELHRVVAAYLMRKPTPLMGDQIRFLRKNAGFSAKKFAALLDIDPSHLSRIERGKRNALGPSTDRLARAVLMAESKGGEAARQVLLKIAERKQIEREQEKNQPLLFKLYRNHWVA
jgi:transcriptional regulator with XRE-family HTH domain